MPAPTISQVMSGIKTRLATISGLETSDVTPDQVSVPIAIVGVPEVTDYQVTFKRGHMDLDFTITVLTSAALDSVGQLALASYADPTGSTSISAAIDGDQTLGGVVEYSLVKSFRPLGREEVGLIGYYGGVFVVNVGASGS